MGSCLSKLCSKGTDDSAKAETDDSALPTEFTVTDESTLCSSPISTTTTASPAPPNSATPRGDGSRTMASGSGSALPSSFFDSTTWRELQEHRRVCDRLLATTQEPSGYHFTRTPRRYSYSRLDSSSTSMSSSGGSDGSDTWDPDTGRTYASPPGGRTVQQAGS